MQIVFNLHNVGLGNNGGSRTLIRCAETLSLLGHDVVMFSNHPNKYTWHNMQGVTFHRGDKQPAADLAIATGYKSVPSVLESKSGKKIYYIRGYETWVTSEKNLFKSYKSLKCIVNSEWLKSHLKSKGVKSHIVYPGLDLDWFYYVSGERERVMGALFHKKHATKRHTDAERVAEKVGCKLVMLNKDVRAPKVPRLREWYNKIRVWFAPTELEGLHNPPMEAALCGCAVVATDHPRSGMGDYVTGDTALTYPARDLDAAAARVDFLIDDVERCNQLSVAMKSLLIEKMGTRKSNMKRFLEIV